uniref:Uncharacterized protein n=1 Tax=Anopheles christyi TaxID=43041 RepID=A0A240PK30_9DIPT
MLSLAPISGIFLILFSVCTSALNLSCSIIHPLPIPAERYMWTPMHSALGKQKEHEEVCIIASVTLNNTDSEVIFPKQQTIELFYARIPYFGPALFRQLDDATVSLELRKGTIAELQYGGSNLKHLKVSDTGMSHFEVLKEDDSPLQTLVIHERLVTVLPMNVNLLTGLKLLDLSGCSLTTLDLSELYGLNSLIALNIADNQLSSVEASIRVALPTLAKFDVQQNELSHIDQFPDMFPALQYTRIMQNRWDCEWVSAARDKIWRRNITVLGTDFRCSGRRINNGGLCCAYAHPARARLAIAKAVLSVLEELSLDVPSIDPLITFKVFENETLDGVVGVEMENVGIYLKDPIGVV